MQADEPPQALAPEDPASDEWARAEYEHMWTMQSDINSRLISVFTAAMGVSFTAIGALTAWVVTEAGKSNDINPYARLLVFTLPALLALTSYVLNLSQRREILLLAAYWVVFVEEGRGNITWASRVANFRALAVRDKRVPRFVARSNDPIPLSYALVFFSTSIIGSAVFSQYPPATPQFLPACLTAVSFISIGAAYYGLTSRWLRVLDSDFSGMKAKWRQVQKLESNRPGPDGSGQQSTSGA